MIDQEGPGWRLAKDPLRQDFPYLIGGEYWSVELSQNEWKILGSTLTDLIDQYENMKNQLMPEEMITLEIERPPFWASLDGKKDLWTLKVILNGKAANVRSVELYWPIPSAQLITSAMRIMWDSNQ